MREDRSARHPAAAVQAWRKSVSSTWYAHLSLGDSSRLLVTKHGLAEALQSDEASFAALPTYFVERLVPVCAELLQAAAAAGETLKDLDAYEVLRAVGQLCIGAKDSARYNPLGVAGFLVAGLRSN